jgi:hypothetical protein
MIEYGCNGPETHTGLPTFQQALYDGGQAKLSLKRSRLLQQNFASADAALTSTQANASSSITLTPS